jgi:very-short-patch-repair endonuclease
MVGSVVLTCCFMAYLTWSFSQPNAWISPIAKPTPIPTTDPIVSTASADGIANLVLVGGLGAILLGGGGLFLMVLAVLTQSHKKQKNQASSINQDSVLASTVASANYISVTPSPPKEVVSNEGVTQNQNMHPTVEENTDLPVDARPIMTKREQAFFYALLHALRNDLVIFPQVPLIELLGANATANLPKELFSMHRDGSVDYVLADPHTLSAVVCVELDDSSHDQTYTRVRDRKKEMLLGQFGIPLLRSRVGETWDSAVLRQEIDQVVPSSVPRIFLEDSERDFFRLLRGALNEHFVFPKVRLSQLIHRADLLPFETYKTFKSDVVDFVIGHQRYLDALLAIELEKASTYDQEKQKLLKSADIPLLYFDKQNPPSAAQLRQEILSAIRAKREKK